MSSCRGFHSYGILDLIGAFVYLAVGYVMLWVATWVYVVSRFLGVLGFFLPCPCEGILGFRSDNLCLRSILVEFPSRKMYSVWCLVERILVLSEYAGGGLSVVSVCESRGSEIADIGGEGKGCSSSASLNSGLKGGRFDGKGKSLENRKQRHGLRRRRKGGLGYEKLRRLNLGSPDSGISSSYNDVEMVYAVAKMPESFSHVGVMDYRLLDSEKTSVGDNLGEKTWDSHELCEIFDGGKAVSREYTSSVENVFVNGLHNLCNEDEANRRIRILEQALAEEKDVRAALYLELEEERAAAATAADEAMAMIFRLQEAKAMIEMEVRQSQRMIEEKVAYDEEEMNILKEILIRRERESFFLENELQAYKQASSSDESGEDLSKCTADVSRRRPSSLINPDEDSYLMQPRDREDENLVHLNRKLPDTSKNSFQSRARQLQTSEEEVEAVYDVHVVDDTNGHGNGSVEELKLESHNSCINKRQKIDREVEWLRELLRIVQEGKEQVRLSSGEIRYRSTTKVNLLEDIPTELQEIEWTTGPSQPASC